MSDELPSKTRRKKEMHALQALGAELVELSEQQLAAVDLPERLRDAVYEARRMTKFEARRRQLQYIGKIMREVDPDPIRRQIDAWKNASRAHTARLHAIERWRTRLIEESDAIDALVREYPHADPARFRALVSDAAHERATGQAPKSYRAIFRELDRIVEKT